MQRWPISLLTGHARCRSSPMAVPPAWLLLRWPSGPAVGRLCANPRRRNRSSAAVTFGSGRAIGRCAIPIVRSEAPRGAKRIAGVMLLSARGGRTSILPTWRCAAKAGRGPGEMRVDAGLRLHQQLRGRLAWFATGSARASEPVHDALRNPRGTRETLRNRQPIARALAEFLHDPCETVSTP